MDKRTRDQEPIWMGQQWDQIRNQIIFWNKWKWEANNTKSMGHRKNSPKMEIHSIISLPQATKKYQMNILTLHLKDLEK